jgi:hypothetical protein
MALIKQTFLSVTQVILVVVDMWLRHAKEYDFWH